MGEDENELLLFPLLILTTFVLGIVMTLAVYCVLRVIRNKKRGMHRAADESPHVKKAMNEDENEISLNQLSLSNERAGEFDGEKDYFPFLALPDELIGNTFSFLPIRDRMRARVNRRLDKIELYSKYFVEQLHIRDVRKKQKTPFSSIPGNEQRILFIIDKPYSSDCIKRLTQNTSIGFLHIGLSDSTDFHREACNLIKEFDVENLNFVSWSMLADELMVDSFFLDLTRICKSLDLTEKLGNMHGAWNCKNVTPEALHQVYKMMMEGSAKIRKLAFEITQNQCVPFLGMIGISYSDDTFFSSRNIEAIKQDFVDDYGSSDRFPERLFDGRLEIALNDGIFYHWMEDGRIPIAFTLHETEESLEKAKNREGFHRINVVPE